MADTVTITLAKGDALQLQKRLRHPFNVNVGREKAFRNLLAALDSAIPATP